ncbi:MAG: DUF421 domain-containing protein [Aquabacterium sp.]
MDLDKLIDLFTFSMSPLELALRGTAMYWFLFCIFRFVMRRDVGSIAIADVLLLVIVADASQNAMAGEYETIADGMLLVGVIVAWNWLIDWGAYRWVALHKFLQPPPLLLVYRGHILHRNLRQEFVNVADLMAELRKNGVEDIKQVRRAFMESDGTISVLKEGEP